MKDIADTPRGPELIVSRADTILLQKLFEQEVPEIANGSVDIMSIAREAGNRSKVSVVAKQEGIDAVGSCVGLRGIRIQSIVSELQGEKIDVVEWHNDPKVLITSSLNPAQVAKVELVEEEKIAIVWVPNQHLSLAIGREGQNARLAAKMTDWKIDFRSIEPEEANEEEVDNKDKIFTPGHGEDVFRKIDEQELVEEEVAEEPVAAEEEVAEEPVAAEEDELITLRDADEDLFSIEKLFGTNDSQSQIRFAEDIDELKSKSNTNKKSNK